ncbi:MAG TPA: alpha/beta hydrolase, partial [Halothiobacillaceae bacterium]|nr:alpha/beta hydrolase [Halothiobacillaceae bacterium]
MPAERDLEIATTIEIAMPESNSQKRQDLVAWLLTLAAAALGGLFFIKNKSPLNKGLYVGKMLATALSPFVALLGIRHAVRLRSRQAARGVGASDWPSLVAGGTSGILAFIYVWRVATQHAGFEQAFGPDWRDKIPPAQATRTRRARRMWVLPRYLARVPRPLWARDVVYWTLSNSVSGEERPLLCDVWQPPESITPSGLALIYCHGGGWHGLDKDFGTRVIFRYLAAQGHLVMDVAYRLWPETDLYGMVGDVKRAIVWLKANAGEYGINPERIVVSGGSAGGHLALLAAYTPYLPTLTPDDLRSADASVRAVVSFYGAVD